MILHVLLALVVILLVTKAFGMLARKIGEPSLVGEIMGGIALGPSLVGILFPGLSAFLFPANVLPFISFLAQYGIILFMFVVGLEFNLASLQKNSKSTVFISHSSIILPMILGMGMGVLTLSDFAPTQVNVVHYALFFGISLSVTAFPVLAGILYEKNLHKSSLGTVALACAAVDDVTAWCLLAFCLSLMKAQLSDGILTLALTAVYLVTMMLLLRPWLEKLSTKLGQRKEISLDVLSIFFAAMFLSAAITEAIGIHAIFGAFFLGVLIPHESQLKESLVKHSAGLSKMILLPIFFAFTGLRTQFGLLNTWQDWVWCLLIILVAVIGKFGGATLAALYCKLKRRDAVAIGVLMNTRGLVELVVLNIGLDMGLLTPRLFAMLVIMALVTTFMTSPLINRILGLKNGVADKATLANL